MATKMISIMSKIRRLLTHSCQSGLNTSTLAGMVLIAATAPVAAEPTGWAHQAAGFQSNGAVTVKSLAGSSYVGTQNPTGAVAKANQNAATQAPTVIIQATAAGYAETIPLMTLGTIPPACPAGYHPSFQRTDTGCPGSDVSAVYNVSGTRWSLATLPSGSGSAMAAWFADGSPAYNSGSSGSYVVSPINGPVVACKDSYTGPLRTWSASLCSK